MKTLSLLIPGLLGPLPELNGTDAPLPECHVLNTWLARAQKKATKTNSYFTQLAELFGIEYDYSIAHASAIFDQCQSDDAFWYRADPVHFKADMDHALLIDSQQLDINYDEALSLAASFNQHFMEDGLVLVAAHADRWYLQSQTQLNINTTCLGDAIGRNVSHFLPAGEDALNWRKLLNETQMLFHTHQINEQRENNSQLSINSLWLWGEGVPLSAGPDKLKWVMSEEPVASGLSMISNSKHMPMVKSVDDIAEFESGGLIVIDSIMGPVNYGDVSSWHENVMTLCQQWLEPLDALLKNRKIEQLNLYTANGKMFNITPNKLLKFWRRSSSIKNSMTINTHA